MRGSLELTFGEGKFPDFYEDMNAVQKIVLNENKDAVNLMFMLGKVNAIMATCTEKQFADWVLKNVISADLAYFYSIAIGIKAPKNQEEKIKAKKLYEEITSNREIATLDFIEEYRKKNPNVKSVSLVYGAAHDFEAYQKKYPELRIRKINLKRYQKSREDIYKILTMNPYELELRNRRYEPFYLDPITGTYQIRMSDF